jgi:putative transposase
MRYRSAHKTVHSARYQLVWCPKDRRVLVAGVDARLKAILAEVAAGVGVEVIGVEAMPDHVQPLAEVPPTSPSRFVGLLKGLSSRLLRMQFPCLRRLPALWSPSWSVSMVGGAPLAVVEHRQAVAGR